METGQDSFSKRPFPPLLMNACSLKPKFFVGTPWEKFPQSRQSLWSKEMREGKRRKSALAGVACSSGIRLFTWIHWGQADAQRLDPLFCLVWKKHSCLSGVLGISPRWLVLVSQSPSFNKKKKKNRVQKNNIQKNICYGLIDLAYVPP